MPLWVISPVIAVFIAGFATLWIAIEHAPTELTDPYQQRGDVSNARFDADYQAAEKGLSARLQFDPSQCAVQLTSAPTGVETLILSVRHATRQQLDWQAHLSRAADGSFDGPCQPHHAGRYYVQLTDTQHTWRLIGDWSGQPSIVLSPRSLAPR